MNLNKINYDASVPARDSINLLNFLTEANYNVSEANSKVYINLVTSSYEDNSNELKDIVSNITVETILNLSSSELMIYLEDIKESVLNYIDSNNALINKLR